VNTLNRIISVGTSLGYNRFLLQQEFYNVIIRKCPELKYLDMISIEHQIFYFSEAKARLESLCELKCDASIDSSFFYGLGCVCHNIQRLIIINTNKKVNCGIVKLIEFQENLKYFEWRDAFEEEYFMDLLEDPYTEIFHTLAKHANSLNHFVVYLESDIEYNYHKHVQKYEFLPIILLKLHKLKSLNICFPFLNKDFYEQLKTLTYNDLETFETDYISISSFTCTVALKRFASPK